MPATIYFCMNQKKMTLGTAKTVAAAITSSKGVLSIPINEARPTDATQLLCEEINVDANRYSSQASKKQITPAATKAGSANGRVTRANTPMRLQPSTRAASSISIGIVSK